MGFQQGLSGLNGASKALEAIGNNVANSNTVGFKSATTEFSDVYAAALNGGGSTQVGIGTTVSGVVQQFAQGNITTSSNPLDVAINGNGFFLMNNNGATTYTRDGQFQVDKNGYIVNAAGLKLEGYAATSNGDIPITSPVSLQVSHANINPQATGTSALQVNLDSRATVPSTATSGSASFALAASTVTVATGTNDGLNLVVDGHNVSIAIDAGTYTSTDVTSLASQIQGKINTALSGTDASVTCTNSNGNVLITSNSKGTVVNTATSPVTGSSVTLQSTNGTALTATSPLFNSPTLVTGADNFNNTSSSASGELIGKSLSTPIDITSSNNVLNLTVDGSHNASVTLAANNYTSLTTLASDLQSALNTALSGASVTVSLDAASNQLVIASTATGTSSGVVLQSTPGTMATTVLGDSPTVVAGGTNLNSVNPSGFTASTAETVYDSLGNPHNLTLYFSKTAVPGTWQLFSTLDGTGQTIPTTLITFDSAGKMTSPTSALTQSFVISTGATSPMQFSLDLTGTTQYGVTFGVNQVSQDGYTSGQLSGLSISNDGTIQGRYSNGQSRNMGRIALATFNNLNGLQSVGGNQWISSFTSGDANVGAPGTGSLGSVQAGAIEESNVDLTAELVNMITQQRAYQANAQTIKTEDSILQTLVNLR